MLRRSFCSAVGFCPSLAAHGVEGICGPGHDMKRVNTAFRIWAVFFNAVGDPASSVRADTADRCALLRRQEPEKFAQNLFSKPFVTPNHAMCVVVDDHGHVLVTFLVTGFVDSKLDKTVESVRRERF